MRGAQLSQTPFDLLIDIERRGRARARGLPVDEMVREKWIGITFSVRGNSLVAPLQAVSEVITPPGVVSVPGVKPWVLGIANMRGALLPIIDLAGFLFGENLASDVRTRRILVIECAEHSSGVLVDAVAGLKHFWADERSEELPALDPELKPYIGYAYLSGEHRYALFDFASLTRSKPFLEVAA